MPFKFNPFTHKLDIVTETGGSFTVNTLTGDTGGAVPPTGGNITLHGGSNMNTVGHPGTSTIDINLDDTVSISGSFTAGTTAGDITLTNGNLNLPAAGTWVPGTTGIVYLNSNRFLHATGDFGNVFLGQASGNLGATGAFVNTAIGEGTMQNLSFNSANYNTAVGGYSQQSAQAGGYNSTLGAYSLQNSSNGQYNVAIGTYTMNNINSSKNTGVGYDVMENCGTRNTAIGFSSGSAYTGDENNNILLAHPGVAHESNTMHLGDQGSGEGQINTTYIAGVTGVPVNGAPVYCASDGQFGSMLPNQVVMEFDDFLSDSDHDTYYIGKLDWGNDNHNFALTAGEAGHDGIIVGTNGDAAQGLVFSSWNSNSPFILGSGTLSLNWVFKFQTLSAPGARYFAQIGLGDGNQVVEFEDGVYFHYEDDVNSGQWVLKTASGGVYTAQNTSVAVDTNWTNLGVVINADASSVSYYINGTLVGTPITTNIPTAAVTAQWNAFPNGGTAPLHKLDLFYYTRVFTTPR